MTTNPVTATLPAGYTPPSSSVSPTTASSSGVNSDTFLQLLVAQLQYQDPTSPTDSTTFLTQTADFQEVQQLTSLQSSVQSLIGLQQATSASNLLGKQVEAVGADGTTQINGIVTSVQMGSGGPELTVDGQQVALASVLQVSEPSSSAASASTSSSATSGSGADTFTTPPA